MSRVVLVTALVVLFSIVSGDARGQLSDADRSRLSEEIRAAVDLLDPDLLPDLPESTSDVLRRIEETGEYFDRATSPENRDAWLAYLAMDPLAEAIESEKSPGVIAREAIDLRYRLVGTTPGLELTALRNLRGSVEQLIGAARFRNKDRSIAYLANQLGALADRIGGLDDSPSANDFATISAVLGVLETSGQARDLIASMRDTFNRPNMAVVVGEPMVQTAIGRQVNETQPVRDCILGTRIIGDATLSGVVTANLLPSVGTARVNVSLVGNVVSNSIGYNGPVRLRTVGYGDVNVSRSLTFNESGVTLEPIVASASLRSEIRSIEHKLRLVRNIARKKAAQQKSRAERIGADKLRHKVSDRFATQIDDMAALSPPDTLSKIRPLLKRLSLEEPLRLWGSTEKAFFIDTIFRRHDQLASIVSRPPITEPYHVAIQVHESAIDNAFAPVLAGRTLNERKLNEMLEKSGRPVPEAKTDNEGRPEPPFEIDFSRLRPIIFEARGQQLRLGVRGTRFAQGNRELKQAMEITAMYEQGTTEDGKAILLRNGDVEVNFPGKRLSVAQAGLRPTIKKKFSDVFPKVLLDRPLEAPADAKLEAIRGRKFYPRHVDAANGWLTVTVR